MAMQQMEYPVRFSVDYPDRPLDRLSTGFRIFMAIPILIVLGTVSGGNGWDWSSNGSTRTAAVGAGGLLSLGPLLLLLFRHKYPRWWFDYPDVPRDLNRWLPLVKWLLAFPHYFVLFFLEIAALVVVIVAWFAILFTGRYPPFRLAQ
jgi:hypothetical protein